MRVSRVASEKAATQFESTSHSISHAVQTAPMNLSYYRPRYHLRKREKHNISLLSSSFLFLPYLVSFSGGIIHQTPRNRRFALSNKPKRRRGYRAVTVLCITEEEREKENLRKEESEERNPRAQCVFFSCHSVLASMKIRQARSLICNRKTTGRLIRRSNLSGEPHKQTICLLPCCLYIHPRGV